MENPRNQSPSDLPSLAISQPTPPLPQQTPTAMKSLANVETWQATGDDEIPSTATTPQSNIEIPPEIRENLDLLEKRIKTSEDGKSSSSQRSFSFDRSNGSSQNMAMMTKTSDSSLMRNIIHSHSFRVAEAAVTKHMEKTMTSEPQATEEYRNRSRPTTGSQSFLQASPASSSAVSASSNQTMITSHLIAKGGVKVAETPPVGITNSKCKKTLVMSPNQELGRSIISKRDAPITSMRRKAAPKRGHASVTDQTGSNKSPKKRKCLKFSSPSINGSSDDLNHHNSIDTTKLPPLILPGQPLQRPPPPQLLPQLQPQPSLRAHSNSSNTPPLPSHNSSSNSNPIHRLPHSAKKPPPISVHNNKRINDFFSPKKHHPTTPPQNNLNPHDHHLDHHHKSNNTTNTINIVTTTNTPTTNTAELELSRLRSQIHTFTAKLQEQTQLYNAVTSTRSITEASLRTILTQKETQMASLKDSIEQIQLQSQKRDDKYTNAIEVLVRNENARLQGELRQKLASDGARLGKIVYTRTGMHNTVETWEEGYEYKKLQTRQKEFKKKSEALEMRKRTHTTKNSLDQKEFEESMRMHFSNLTKQQHQLSEETAALHLEKGAHIRALKLIASQDSSRFQHKPTLNHRYILLNLLGKGGFSEVWRAYDRLEVREVAVKIHQLDPIWSEAKKENYTKHVSREYEIHRDVRHDRIVSLYDVFEIDLDSFATVLECCKGTDLDALLKRLKIMTERDARAVLLQILSGMRYLSSPSEDGSRKGIIHYDLKPGNILFDEFGDAKITDFGLSKILEEGVEESGMELTSQGAGTYWYLPPECFVVDREVRISNKVDVWSIGVIFYQMLFGKRPFGDGQSQEKVMINQVMLNAKELKFPPKPQVTPQCKEFLLKCLTYEHTFRPNISQLCTHEYLMIDL